MDIEDWEILPHGGFTDYLEDGEEKNLSSNQNNKINMNYFICPSSSPSMLVQPSRVVPVPFLLESYVSKDSNLDMKVVPCSVMMMEDEIKGPDLLLEKESGDQDPISQVFFKKMKENEFVDIKMDSPKSPTKGSFVPPQIDGGKFDFQDKDEILDTKICSPRIKNEEVEEDEVNLEENGGGLNLWKWSLSGIGAICSFGVAAATVCVIIFGSQQRTKSHDHNHQLRFQIYADDNKRMKQVFHHATKLNEEITVRGVPISRAHITCGGYCEGL